MDLYLVYGRMQIGAPLSPSNLLDTSLDFVPFEASLKSLISPCTPLEMFTLVTCLSTKLSTRRGCSMYMWLPKHTIGHNNRDLTRDYSITRS